LTPLSVTVLNTQCRNVHLIVGGERTKDAKELLYARQKLVLVAKAFQLQAIDIVHIDYKGCCDCIVIDVYCM